MTSSNLTDSELLLLGLIAEMPRHGYELEQIIEDRGMRQWTQIAFSSIYFVLGKLEKAGLISGEIPAGTKARKVVSVTELGRSVLIDQTIAALATYRPVYPSILLGMVNWQAISRDAAFRALDARLSTVRAEDERLERLRRQRQPMPDHIELMFDFSAAQLKAEQTWIRETLDYMRTKP